MNSQYAFKYSFHFQINKTINVSYIRKEFQPSHHLLSHLSEFLSLAIFLVLLEKNLSGIPCIPTVA